MYFKRWSTTFNLSDILIWVRIWHRQNISVLCLRMALWVFLYIKKCGARRHRNIESIWEERSSISHRVGRRLTLYAIVNSNAALPQLLMLQCGYALIAYMCICIFFVQSYMSLINFLTAECDTKPHGCAQLSWLWSTQSCPVRLETLRLGSLFGRRVGLADLSKINARTPLKPNLCFWLCTYTRTYPSVD